MLNIITRFREEGKKRRAYPWILPETDGEIQRLKRVFKYNYSREKNI